MFENKPTVVLDPTQTALAPIPASVAKRAFDLALRFTMSPHEHEWTDEEAGIMAWYVLWASQRLSGIKQLVDGPLDRPADE